MSFCLQGNENNNEGQDAESRWEIRPEYLPELVANSLLLSRGIIPFILVYPVLDICYFRYLAASWVKPTELSRPGPANCAQPTGSSRPDPAHGVQLSRSSQPGPFNWVVHVTGSIQQGPADRVQLTVFS